MTKHKMDEFYVSPSYALPGIPGRAIAKTTKRAWEENILKQTDKRTFYPEFYKYAMVLKIFGFFPVHLTKYSSDLKFTWTSASTLFSVLILPVIQTFIVYICPLDIFKQFFQYTSVVFPLGTTLLYMYKLPTIIKLIQLMDSIDTNHCLKKGGAKETRKNTNFVIGFLLISSLLASSPINALLYGLTPGALNSVATKIVRVIVKIMETSVVYVVCYQLIVLYDRYHASLASLEERPCEEVSEQTVEEYRLVHSQLVRCVRLLDASFGFWLMLTYTNTCYQFIKASYSAMYGDQPAVAVGVALTVSYKLCYIFYPAVLTDRINTKNKDTIHFTFRMALKPYPEDVLYQIYYFMRQVRTNVAAVSAGGLADVNKEIITKALSLFATFFIATIQLEPQMTIWMDNFTEWLIQITGKQDFTSTTTTQQTFST